MRRGFRGAVGVESSGKKARWWENLLWALLLLAAIGMLIARYSR